MSANMSLNQRTERLADELAARTAELKVETTTLARGARVLDCGIKAAGGLQAGLALARICLADLGKVSLTQGPEGLLVQVATDWPVAACMASQYAGWQISVGKFFAMGSGPMRAAAGREELFDKIGFRETADSVVGVLESRKLPDDAVIEFISEKAKVPPERITLLVAPTASLAGTLQVVARSIETALHKLFELGFDLSQVQSGFGTAPMPPIAKDDMQAIGWTNDAILYGGRAVLWVRCDDAVLQEIGPKVPSSASPDHGAPFAAIFERYQRDFYKIDPMLFSPAEVVFHSLNSGRTFVFGAQAPDVLRRSFGEK